MALRVAQQIGDPFDEVWSNGLYECQVRYLQPELKIGGALHLSIKRNDRSAERDWRHLQSIKNEVVGHDREALELFPAERRLVDNANQIHLWVTPPDMEVPFGFVDRWVNTEDQIRAECEKRGLDVRKARQRDWQDGLSTGPKFWHKLHAEG